MKDVLSIMRWFHMRLPVFDGSGPGAGVILYVDALDGSELAYRLVSPAQWHVGAASVRVRARLRQNLDQLLDELGRHREDTFWTRTLVAGYAAGYVSWVGRVQLFFALVAFDDLCNALSELEEVAVDILKQIIPREQQTCLARVRNCSSLLTIIKLITEWYLQWAETLLFSTLCFTPIL